MSSKRIPDKIRLTVRKRADDRCEYCLLPEFAVLGSHQCDHIIARKHGGDNEVDNLALSCKICNKHKGTDLTSIDPRTGEITALYSPRKHHWSEHFELDSDGTITAQTPEGRVTVYLLQLNRAERVIERQLYIESGDIVLPATK